MYSVKACERLRNILKKINFIDSIVSKKGGIILALEDEEESRAAILMHLTSIAEQFDKLLKDGEIEILSQFKKEDIKGSYALRNYYEGVDLYIVESVIENRLPLIKKSVDNILKKCNGEVN